tara:strand:- start:1368 stop:1595 length:228 start_codon:yes stop_codon:yes gene_type:complete
MYQGETINPGAKRNAQRGEQMILKPKKCPNCFGDGWIPIIKVISSSGDFTHSELEDVGEEDCPECNGTGEEKIYA